MTRWQLLADHNHHSILKASARETRGALSDKALSWGNSSSPNEIVRSSRGVKYSVLEAIDSMRRISSLVGSHIGVGKDSTETAEECPGKLESETLVREGEGGSEASKVAALSGVADMSGVAILSGVARKALSEVAVISGVAALSEGAYLSFENVNLEMKGMHRFAALVRFLGFSSASRSAFGNTHDQHDSDFIPISRISSLLSERGNENSWFSVCCCAHNRLIGSSNI
mmetsp:Transcript_43967/g.71530  ORF Transcript_43967/g.71530 Transcript_43967/m.71530 type:complete len:228 (+) Transcript_43967:105-788(+)